MDQKPYSRKFVTISDKQKIIVEIASGSTMNDMSRKYGISRSCVSKINKQKDYIASFSKSVHNAHLKKIHKVRRPMNCDAALYSWFCQQRSWGQPVSGPLLCEKAADINKTLGGPASFKVIIPQTAYIWTLCSMCSYSSFSDNNL